jgi:potassium/hydrogen antiporter
MTDGELILVAGALLAAGLLASLLAFRLRVPSLVLFLGVGMAIGSDGAGWIDFGDTVDDYELARTIGIIALALILFEGGLTSGLLEIRSVLGSAVSLALAGTALTAAITGLAAVWLFDLDTLEGLLLGSIVAATDSAAIFALLRTSSLRRRLARALEGESGFNDPIAILLVLGFIEWIQQPDYGVADMAWLFARQLSIGLLIGAAVGWGAVHGFRRLRLTTAGLYPVASLAVAGIAFGAADTLDGSGFLAVYIAGLAVGSAVIPAKQTVVSFHQGLAWVAQVAMFLTLGLLVFPAELDDVALEGTVLALVLVLVARPLAATAATAFGSYSNRERLVLGWAGLRGAVPVVLATFPVIAGVPGSQEFFNIVFFAVLLSTLLQGSTFEPVAHRLGATAEVPALPSTLIDPSTLRQLGTEMLEFEVAPGDAADGQRIRDLGLPQDALVSVILREGRAVPPRGSSRLRAGDRLQLLVREESTGALTELSDRWRSGPVGPAPRPPARARGYAPLFVIRPWGHDDGDPAQPGAVAGEPVVERLRERRDRPGSLVLLADGRYAVTGRLLAVGSRRSLTQWARRRLTQADPEERAWLQGVVGTLAADEGLGWEREGPAPQGRRPS